MNNYLSKRLLSLLLVAAFLVGFAVPVNANESNANITWEQVDNSEVTANGMTAVELPADNAEYADTDVLRVSIVLDEKSTIAAGFKTENIAENASAMAYRGALQEKQASVTAAIEKKLGAELDVVWNLTLAGNLISANVEYGQIEAIEAVDGVSQVLIETLHSPAVVEKTEDEVADPNMATSGKQIGSAIAWETGYTGAGMRIAVIDTGTDTDHMSLNEGAFQYSLAYQAGLSGLSLEEYMEKIDLLDVYEIASVADQLNAPINANTAYINTKLPFGYNYIDEDYDITHDNDKQSSHGSHVAGIATANAYVDLGEGNFGSALEYTKLQGVAPDAQLITMKVFGKGGGAYDSDYMVAIEDAVILGCDAVNLSLGSSSAGNTRCANAVYQEILENLENSGTVVAMAAGNEGYRLTYGYPVYPYAEDINTNSVGSPSSYTNALSVASVDNDGTTFAGQYLVAGTAALRYFEHSTQPAAYGVDSILTMPGTYEYIVIDGYGSPEDWAALGDLTKGKILVCSRGGDTNYAQKGNIAVEAGALATIIYMDTGSNYYPSLSGYNYSNPLITMSRTNGANLKALAEETLYNDAGEIIGYLGKMTLVDDTGINAVQFNSEYYTMSSFSSWGVPSSLTMKPEITAPGGNIFSIEGTDPAGNAFEIMSGTSMATPQITGMSALVKQYIEENDLDAKTGLDARTLAQSLLMSTAVPLKDGSNDGNYYPILQQGAGLANVGDAINADSYILMGEDATDSWADGKVKAELGDDPQRTGEYSFTFTINNLSGRDNAYALSADFFMQSYFDHAVDEEGLVIDTFMDYLTKNLPMEVTWKVNGVAVEPSADVTGMDFNGDGNVNGADGEALLGYVVGTVEAIENAGKADIDADGDIDTYDAYLFYKAISTGSALVPANGSVTVEVTAVMPEAARNEIEEVFVNGTFVQGFVYAKGADSPEGDLGTTHSIPVLGFYGNWTDSSMYDRGNTAEILTGDITKVPYSKRTVGNNLLITYADNPMTNYVFEGNPVIPDSYYMPERNAINAENGDTITAIQFEPIRNASASRISATNLTTGESLLQRNLYPITGLHMVYSGWFVFWSNGYSQNLTLAPSTAKEGDQLEFRLTLAPEYYVDEEGNVDWDALGKGAHYVVPMVVDNTAPEMYSLAFDVLNNTIVVKASDNQYVAGVGLYTRSGKTLIAGAGSKTDIQPGETAEYVIDLSEVNGNEFLLQVCDYAMNRVTYKIETQIGGDPVVPYARSYNRSLDTWMTHNLQEWDTIYFERTDYTNWRAATVAERMVYITTDEGGLYVTAEEDIEGWTLIRNLGRMVDDMAYNKVDKKIYGSSEGELITIDKYTGDVTVVGKMPFGKDCSALACDANGTFYTNKNHEGVIYTFTLDTLDAPVALIDVEREYQLGYSDYFGLQAMEIDFNTGNLCWITYCYGGPEYDYHDCAMLLIGLGENEGYFEYHDGFFEDRTAALIISDRTEPDTWTYPEDKVTQVAITQDVVEMYRNGRTTLYGVALPWSISERDLTWSSSDPTVATVDAKGVVTAVGNGTAIITATSVADPTISDTCTINVKTLDATLEGAVSVEEDAAYAYTWNTTETTWTKGATLDTTVAVSFYDAVNDEYYIQDADDGSYAMHKMDMSTGKTIEKYGACGYGFAMNDIAVMEAYTDENTTMSAGVVNSWFLPNTPQENTYNYGFNLWYPNLYTTTDANEFIAITSSGATTNEAGETRELMYAIDNLGYIWLIRTDGGNTVETAYIPSDLWVTYPSINDFQFGSLVYANDGSLFFSHFDGKTNEVYHLVYNAAEHEYKATSVGTFGKGVYPATLNKATVNAAGTNGAPVNELNFVEIERASDEEFAAFVAEQTQGERPVVRPESSTDPIDADKTVTIDVTVSDAEGRAIASTNGLVNVKFDAEQLTLTDVTVNGDYSAKIESDGSVTFGYVALTEIAAGGTVATLTFQAKDDSKTEVTVETKQVNNVSGGTETVTVEFEHKNTELRYVVEATCTTAGYTGDTYCKDCGKLLEQGKIIEAKGHIFGEWKTTKPATCTEIGEETRTCTECDVTETRVIPATGHSFGEWTVTTPATCTEDGVETRKCTCGETETRAIPATGHSFGEWKVTKEATCTEKGIETRTCACGETETREIAAHGHDTKSVVVAPTCEQDGYTEHTCEVCGETWRDTIVPATGHNYEAVVTAPTCVDKGYTTYTCTVCGESYVDDYVDATGHTFGEWIVITEPTCTTEGEEVRTCECGETETRAIPAYCPTAGYTDVPLDAWYHDAVDYAVENGLMEGTADQVFNPNGTATRAQIVTILYRMEGEPEVELTDKFTDVADGRWYTEAVSWAVENGITKGMSETKFAPDAAVTREQVVLFLSRYAELKGETIESETDLSAFADAAAVGEQAKTAMAWAVDNGIITGIAGAEGTILLAPKATSTRAQIATILMRFLERD